MKELKPYLIAIAAVIVFNLGFAVGQHLRYNPPHWYVEMTYQY